MYHLEAEKLQEHYGITVAVSSAQAITQKPRVKISQKTVEEIIDGVELLITEMDGTPTVKTTPATDEEVQRPDNLDEQRLTDISPAKQFS